MPVIIAAGVSAAGSAASSGKSGKGSKPAGTTTTNTTPFLAAPITNGTNYLQGALDNGTQNGDWRGLGASPVPLSPETQAALQMARTASSQNSGALQNASNLNNMFLTGAFGGTSYGSLDALSKGQFGSTGYAPLQAISNGDFSGSPGYSGLLATANGNYLPGAGGTFTGGSGAGSGLTFSGSGNPFTDNLVNQAGGLAQSGITSTFNQGGRLGSGASRSSLVSGLSNAASSILSPIYQGERQLQQGAQTTLGGAQSGAATTLGGAQANAGQLLGGVQQNAIQAAPGAFQASLLPSQVLQGIGSFYDNYNQQQQDAPFNSIKNYFSTLGSAGGSGGSTTSPFFTSPLAGILGSGLLGGQAGSAARSLLGGGSGTDVGGSSTKGLFGANGLLGSYGPIFGSGEQFGPNLPPGYDPMAPSYGGGSFGGPGMY